MSPTATSIAESKTHKTRTAPTNPDRPAFPLGTIVNLDRQIDQRFDQVVRLGLTTVQLACWQPRRSTAAAVESVRQAAERHDLTVTTFWAGYGGPAVCDFLRGPATIDLVPER
jgi:sugar phosphate isomerase/epimerase